MTANVKPSAMVEQAANATVVPTTAQITNQGLEALKDITFGSAAGIMGKFVEYPFDTVKVRLQSQPDHLPLRYSGPLDCFRQSFRESGFLGLYRGISAPLVGAAAENACLFFSYRVAKDVLRATVLPSDIGEDLPLSALATAGAMAGGVASLVLTPIELVKCRLQVAPPLRYREDIGGGAGAGRRKHGPFSVIAEVYRQEGLAGFWRGQLGTLLREAGGSAAWFGSYETLSLFFRQRLPDPRNDALPIWQQMASGAAAGMSYNFILYPADTIKSKIQTGELTHVGSGFMQVGRELYRTHGLKGLYRGCGITVARSAPSSALIFTIYESLRKAFA